MEENRLTARTTFDPSKTILLFNASKALASTTDIDQLLNVIVSEVRGVLNCEAAGLLLYDKENDDFYWRNVQDIEKYLSSARKEIRIPKDEGVCGWVFQTGRPALIHDAAGDPRLYRPVEDKSGFLTRNMICVPLPGRGQCLGVLYALNSIRREFTEEDVEILTALAGNIALAIENATYYEGLTASHKELERLNRVKNRMLNHLSHELKTPLAIIEASIQRMERRLAREGMDTSSLPFDRIYRNIGRLKSIETQVAHIVEDQDVEDRIKVSSFIDYLPDLLAIGAEEESLLKDASESIQKIIDRSFPRDMETSLGISVGDAFQAAESRLRRNNRERLTDVRFGSPDPATIRIPRQILVSVLDGLIRNAVENTPDGGTIAITGQRTKSGYTISVIDFGVGIPESEQENIFEGFCPVPSSDVYSSGQPYEFNAGGTGADLLKMKIFSERFGFKISFRSRRCPSIPTAADMCPGDVQKCPDCRTVEDCRSRGGTEFRVEFPENLIEPA